MPILPSVGEQSHLAAMRYGVPTTYHPLLASLAGHSGTISTTGIHSSENNERHAGVRLSTGLRCPGGVNSCPLPNPWHLPITTLHQFNYLCFARMRLGVTMVNSVFVSVFFYAARVVVLHCSTASFLLPAAHGKLD